MVIVYLFVCLIAFLFLILLIKQKVKIVIKINEVKVYFFNIKILSLKNKKLYSKIITIESKMISEQNKESKKYFKLLKSIKLEKIIIDQGLKGYEEILPLMYGIKKMISNLPVIINLSDQYLDTTLTIKVKFRIIVILKSYFKLRSEVNGKQKYT